MEDGIEVMRRLVELAETCHEGLQYIAARLEEGHFEEMLYLFEDVVYGFCKIQDVVSHPILPRTNNRFNQLTLEIETAMHLMLTAYENNNINEGAHTINHQLVPKLNQWRDELESHFKSYILS